MPLGSHDDTGQKLIDNLGLTDVPQTRAAKTAVHRAALELIAGAGPEELYRFITEDETEGATPILPSPEKLRQLAAILILGAAFKRLQGANWGPRPPR